MPNYTIQISNHILQSITTLTFKDNVSSIYTSTITNAPIHVPQLPSTQTPTTNTPKPNTPIHTPRHTIHPTQLLTISYTHHLIYFNLIAGNILWPIFYSTILNQLEKRPIFHTSIFNQLEKLVIFVKTFAQILSWFSDYLLFVLSLVVHSLFPVGGYLTDRTKIWLP